MAVDLVLGPRPVAENLARGLERSAVPVTHAHDRCVLDHLALVRERLSELAGGRVTLDLGELAP